MKNKLITAKKIDSFDKDNLGCAIEYDGILFEANSEKACINQIIEYIFEINNKVLNGITTGLTDYQISCMENTK